MPDDKLPFRAWLVKQLLRMRWSAPPTATLPQIAQYLGVTVDVLEEVVAERAIETQKRGRAATPRRKRALFRTDYELVRVNTPPDVAAAWKEYRGVLQITTSALLRSLVHHFLISGGPRPTSIGRAWRYNGRVQRMKHDMPEITTRITTGALTALDHYADEWGVSGMAITRGLVTDLLEGKVKRLRIVAFSELWGDPDRYLHPEKFTRG